MAAGEIQPYTFEPVSDPESEDNKPAPQMTRTQQPATS